MTTRPYELLARFDSTGNVAGVSIKSISNVNGKDYELDPVPLAGTADPAFTAFATEFAAGVVTERDALATDKTKLTTDLASMTAEHDALVAEKASLIAANAKASADTKTASDKVLAETQANHAQIILAKDADFNATRSELIGTTLVKNELQTKVTALNELAVTKDAEHKTIIEELDDLHDTALSVMDTEIARLKAAFNPPIPTPVIGATKTVSITVDATAWDGILASIYDPTLDVPAEKQATDFILHQYAAKFMAWAERENFKPIDAQVDAAKKQIKEATQARAIEVLSSTKVTIE